jgi:hypothetical protein
MTDQPDDGSGSSLSFEHVRDLRPGESAAAASEPVADQAAANLAFEAAPRMPPPPPPPGDARAALGATTGHGVPSFEAVPISVGAPPQQRLSTATVGFRPQAAAPAVRGVSRPGGSGWNIRRQESPFGGDRSAWDAPVASRRRRASRRILLGTLLAAAVVVLGIVALLWSSGKPHTNVKISTPASVGSLTVITTPATAAVTQEMEKVMLASGATRVVSGVYGLAGHPTLVLLLAQGPNIETSSRQFFNDFATGLLGDGVTVDRSRMVASTTEGSEFVCSPATRVAPLTPISLCGWDDGSTIGLVMDVSGQPVTTTLHEAVAARSAGES